MDKKHTGTRCRSKKLISSFAATIKPEAEGIIDFEIDNLGRRLFSVRWDTGSEVYVFPDEIEIVADDP